MRALTQSNSRGYRPIAIVTSYWRPGEDYHQRIIEALKGKVRNGDVVTISEKAISTAMGNIVDEKRINAGRFSGLLAGPWMRLIWGYMLGTLCHLRPKTIRRFKTYPNVEGSRHKQLALARSGLLQALMHGSEGAIDGSNLPYSFVSLPLQEAQNIADQIRTRIRIDLHLEVSVMIVDTDKSYTYHNFHFTPRPKPINGIQSYGGAFAYLIGRTFKLRKRSTPVALSGPEMAAETALQIAECANKARGHGAGRDVWDMAERFDVGLTEVTWNMLDRIEHKPIVIIRPHQTTHNKTPVEAYRRTGGI
jgi:F420-0:gamma-glutamyl ligase-like protein